MKSLIVKAAAILAVVSLTATATQAKEIVQPSDTVYGCDLTSMNGCPL